MKVAALGFWHVHGDDYARDAAAHEGVDLVALWDDVPERARAAEEKHKVPLRGLDDILDDLAIDGVIICTTTATHRDLAVRCAQAGKHIFIEKVLAATVPEAEQIIEAVRQLRGQAHPKVQVKNCDLAVAHGTGGLLGVRHAASTAILERV